MITKYIPYAIRIYIYDNLSEMPHELVCALIGKSSNGRTSEINETREQTQAANIILL